MEQTITHSLLYNQDGIVFSGITAVESYDAKSILLRYAGGVIEVHGMNFALKDMPSGTGKVSFSGKIFSLEYKDKIAPASLLKKWFK